MADAGDANWREGEHSLLLTLAQKLLQPEGVCGSGKKVYSSFLAASFLLCTNVLKKKKISFTCLSYKFHMIGSGAAYQVGKKGSR